MFSEISIQQATTAISVISSIAAVVSGYFAAKAKAEALTFRSLIAANENFREEVRGDLVIAKEELREMRQGNIEQQQEIDELKRKISDSDDQISKYVRDLDYSKDEVARLLGRICELEMELAKYKAENR